MTGSVRRPVEICITVEAVVRGLVVYIQGRAIKLVKQGGSKYSGCDTRTLVGEKIPLKVKIGAPRNTDWKITVTFDKEKVYEAEETVDSLPYEFDDTIDWPEAD